MFIVLAAIFLSIIITSEINTNPVKAAGNYYYVSTSSVSTDWNAAQDIAAPCTVATAFANAAAGDTVYFRGGTYNVPAKNSGDWMSGYYNVAHSGTAGNQITFMAYPGETPLFNGTSGGSGDKDGQNHYTYATIFSTNYNSYITFDGFSFQANKGTSSARIVVTGGDNGSLTRTTGCVVKNCTFNGGTTAYSSGDNREAIFVSQTNYLTISNCKIFSYIEAANDHNTSGIKTYHCGHVKVENCEIYNNTVGIFYKSDTDDTITRYSYFHNNYQGILITPDIYPTMNTDRLLFYQNIFANNTYLGFDQSGAGSDYGTHGDDYLFFNNTFYNNGTYGLILGYTDPGGYGAEVFNNIIRAGTYSLVTQDRTGWPNYLKATDHNQWGSTFNTIRIGDNVRNTNYTSLSAWQSSGQLENIINVGCGASKNPGCGDLSSDPLFVNGSGNLNLLADFALPANSPDKHVGRGGFDIGASTTLVGVYTVGGILADPPAISDNQAPSAPTNLSAAPVDSNRINLSWVSSADNVGIAGYYIYRDGIKLATSSTNTKFHDSGLAASTLYTYTVAAFDAAGNTSASSTSASTSTLGYSDTAAPSIPTGLTATGVSTSQINLSWTASTDDVGVAGYQIWRSGFLLYITGNDNTSYNNTGLSSNTHYTYTVLAYDAVGNQSAQSASAGATTTAAADVTPPVITAIATSTTAATAVIAWTTNELSTSTVRYGLSSAYGSASSSNNLVTSHSVTIRGLAQNTVYHYRVESTDASHNRATSSDHLFTTAHQTYILTYTAGTHGSISGASPQTVNQGASGSAVTALPISGYHFVDWSDGSTANPRTDTSVAGNVSVTANFLTDDPAFGSIDLTSRYAWMENAGWLDLGAASGSVRVADSGLTGYAWGENIGWINFNPALGGVANDGEGNLSGYAWGENVGWICFGALFGGGLTINSAGDFTGYAWGENVGWIVFNCATTNSCGTVNYKINTDWRPQSYRQPPVITLTGTSTTATTATISWTTDQNATSTVRYGTALPYTLASSSNSFATSHSITLHGLSFNTTYHYQAGSSNVYGNKSTSSDHTLRTNITSYTLSYAAGAHGSISGSSPQIVNSGANGSAVTPVPDTGYHFVDWSDASTANPRTDTSVAANISVTANFAINTYTVTFNKNTGDTEASPTTKTASYNGNVGTLPTAPTKTGSIFASWNTAADGSGTAFNAATAVTADLTVYAQWTINTYTITASTGANGTVTPSGVTTKNYGDSQAYTIATSTAGYHISDILVDSVSVGTSSATYTFTNITANHTISATFGIVSTPPATTYTIGGTISGLSGTVVLQNNGKDDKTISATGSFTFSTATTTGSGYSVTVLTNPSGQTCTVSSGSGTVSGANITAVTVACADNTCATVSHASTYNAYPTCGAASCASGYTLSGSGSAAVCAAQSSGGGGGGSPADTTAPGIPANFKAATSTGKIILSWINPTDSDFAGVKLYRKINSAPTGQTDILAKLIYQGKAVSFADTTATTSQLYYYSIYSFDNQPNYSQPKTISARVSASNQTATSTNPISTPGDGNPAPNTGNSGTNGAIASLINAGSAIVNQVTGSETAALIAQAQPVVLSAIEQTIYAKIIALAIKPLAQELKYLIADFIHLGTPTTLILGAGERAGSISSFNSAFGHLPATAADWQDVIKIGNGRWPTQKSVAAEARAKVNFKIVYGRNPDMNNTHDNAAVTIMAYGLRPAARNTNSEKAAIKSFRFIYHRTPATAREWDIVRAIAYSGAKR
ncbi:MAG: InlB B-repeat-containing protein [Patescibacteria group bacterium]|nr:InlB B-repeat-containing protein [Patescibacteria group bacterium]